MIGCSGARPVSAAFYVHCCLKLDDLRGVVLCNVYNWALPESKEKLKVLLSLKMRGVSMLHLDACMISTRSRDK